jgi:predicted ATPase
MAHITEIKIYGLLGRADPVHLKLERDVNVFFGENGSGKTTLLKILDAAMSRNGDVMLALPVQRAEVYIFSVSENRIIKHVWDRKTKKSDALQHTILEFDWDELTPSDRHYVKQAAPSIPWQLTPKGVARGIRWAHIFLPTTRLYLDENLRSSSKPLTEAQFDAIFVENLNKSWLRYYSAVLSEVSKIQDAGLRTVVNYALAPKLKETVGPILDPIGAYDRVSKFLKRQVATESILGPKTSFLKRYEKEENLRRIVDSIDTLEKLFSNRKSVAIIGNELGIQLENGDRLSIASLSSGEKHLLKIFLSAMSAEENSIIIDEPELSMHIDWQHAFVHSTMNLNPRCQLIIASHSPEIMADLPDEKIFRI